MHSEMGPVRQNPIQRTVRPKKMVVTGGPSADYMAGVVTHNGV